MCARTRNEARAREKERERVRDGRRREKKRRWQIGFDSVSATVVVAQKEEVRMTYATWEG